jgi:hypothetical protein
LAAAFPQRGFAFIFSGCWSWTAAHYSDHNAPTRKRGNVWRKRSAADVLKLRKAFPPHTIAPAMSCSTPFAIAAFSRPAKKSRANGWMRRWLSWQSGTKTLHRGISSSSSTWVCGFANPSSRTAPNIPRYSRREQTRHNALARSLLHMRSNTRGRLGSVPGTHTAAQFPLSLVL